MKHSHNRETVSQRRLDAAIDAAAAEHQVGRHHLRNTRCQDPRAVQARHAVWRALVGPDTSVIDLARRWPCHHTTILDALAGGRTRAR